MHVMLALAAGEAADPDAFLITHPAAVAGFLFITLAFVFRTSNAPRFRRFYAIVPAILLCYFIPSLFATFGIIGDVPLHEGGKTLYWFASRLLLPACLVLLTISIDLPGILRLGPKLLTLFFTATVGVMLGGPLALGLFLLFDPGLLGGVDPQELWKGLATVAGSWIGGGANQLAMKEVFLPGQDLFSQMVAVDVIVANIWMGFLLWMAARSVSFDRWLKADRAAIDDLTERVERMQAGRARIPSAADLFTLLAVAFGITGLAHIIAAPLAQWFHHVWPGSSEFSLDSPFFWLIVLATTMGVAASFTRSARALEDVGASRLGTVFLYTLVAVIGLGMDLAALVDVPVLFLLGLVWILFQGALLFTMAKLIKAPCFFIAVASQANIGGAASAPVVAGAFNPRLAPVGVLLAVLGYAVGTYAALLCANLMRAVSPAPAAPVPADATEAIATLSHVVNATFSLLC